MWRSLHSSASIAFRPHSIAFILFASLLPSTSAAGVTVYTSSSTSHSHEVSTTITSLAAGATYSGLGAYDPLRLTPPAAPSPATTAFTMQVPASPEAAQAANFEVGIPQRGNFLGFSIELSVADVIMGKNGEQLKPEFLNYLANIQVRAGQGPLIRVGGNTQEGSTIYANGLADGLELDKIKYLLEDGYNDTLSSPLVNYSPLLLYTMANISSLVGADWFFGLSFNETAASDPTLNAPTAAEWAQKILGTNLRGLAIGNEPDLYTTHGDRASNWTINDYISEFQGMEQAILSKATLSNQQAFLGPAVCCQVQGFELSDVFDAGFLNSSSSLAAVTVQHYPTNNCQINGDVIDPQDIFSDFLNHTNAQYLVGLYLQDSASTQAAGKELVMLEMNTASCGGFPGLSDSFGAAMWMADYALQMAWGNFSAALMHVGGQDVYYNPFTPPPTNLSDSNQWTTGSVYYSALVLAESLGKSNQSRVSDLSNDTDIYHPVYGIFENDAPTRFVLFNYVNDPTGASTYQVTLSGISAGQVFVRYLQAPSVAEQYNITWAGQTLGESFSSDGSLSGNATTATIDCANNACVVPVYAPSIALVFLSQDAETNSSPAANETASFATTTATGTAPETGTGTATETGSVTVNPSVLATSNGQNGPPGQAGSTSDESASTSGAMRGVAIPIGLVVGALGVIFIRTLVAT